MIKQKSISLTILFFIVMTTVFFLPVRYVSAGIEISSNSAIIINADTGQILYGKNPYTLASSGDFDKLLSIVTALRFENAPEELTVSAQALRITPTAPRLGLQEGQKVRLTDMLYAMYLGGYNDAANVVAENLGQQLIDTASNEFALLSNYKKTETAIDAYVSLMNKTADDLCCTTFKATNADGHHYDTQQCSAADITTLIKNCLDDKNFCKIFLTSSFSLPADINSMDNRRPDYKDKINAAKEKAGEATEEDNTEEQTEVDENAEVEVSKDTGDETVTITRNQVTEGNDGNITITAYDQLFNGTVLYKGIKGGLSAYNSNSEKYHSVVYAENNGTRLIAAVLNGSEYGIYDDLQALLNFGFYKCDNTVLDKKEIDKLLPDNIANKNLEYYGQTEFMLPSGYTVSDLEAAVAYTENGYLHGTVTFTLPKEAPYAGTVSTISFYEINKKSYSGIFIKIGIVLLIAAAVIFTFLFVKKIAFNDSKRSHSTKNQFSNQHKRQRLTNQKKKIQRNKHVSRVSTHNHSKRYFD